MVRVAYVLHARQCLSQFGTTRSRRVSTTGGNSQIQNRCEATLRNWILVTDPLGSYEQLNGSRFSDEALLYRMC